MVVAAIGPNLNALSILLILLTGQIRARLETVELLYHVLALILAEHAEVCESILLPVAFI